MEEQVLLHFEGSRRVVRVPEGYTLEVELERELLTHFPVRDIAVAPIGNKVPQSPSKDVYMLQKMTSKWGYVNVMERGQVQGGDEVTLVKISKVEEVASYLTLQKR